MAFLWLMRIIHWLARILSIAFAIFLSLFSLDVFSEPFGWASLLGLLIHLLPALLVLLFAIIAWKRDWLGAIFFFAVSVAYAFMIGPGRPWSWYACISGPAALIGLMFLLSWLGKRRKNQE